MGQNWFDLGIKWKVGVGDKIRFWINKWVEGDSLANLFPRLFLILELREEVDGKMSS